jgi:hypothetical protein
MCALPAAGVFAASITPQVQKPNCTTSILPLQRGQMSSKVVSSACFATFSQAIAFATHGAISLPTSATPKNLTAAQVKAASMRPNAVLLIGILYQDINEGGFSFVVSTDSNGTPCNSTADYGISDLSVYGWSNAISSLKQEQNNCNFTSLFSGTNYSGSTSECYSGGPLINSVGITMNDLAQSVIWGKLNPNSSGAPHPTTITC